MQCVCHPLSPHSFIGLHFNFYGCMTITFAFVCHLTIANAFDDRLMLILLKICNRFIFSKNHKSQFKQNIYVDPNFDLNFNKKKEVSSNTQCLLKDSIIFCDVVYVCVRFMACVFRIFGCVENACTRCASHFYREL